MRIAMPTPTSISDRLSTEVGTYTPLCYEIFHLRLIILIKEKEVQKSSTPLFSD